MPRASDYPLLRRRLLQWFRKNARPLPWRSSRDPYAIWISEVMLQQTQVATVIPYFERFLQQFPDVQSLADADEQTVLRFWEGLGYYRRARGLCQAARRIVELGHATIPDDAEFVQSLPGFGRYTTNAVLSQAFDRRLPILEANSQRVLCRLFGIDSDPKQSATQKQLWQLAADLLPVKSAGDFNQALMELGALVCKPAKPNCENCQLSAHCEARRQNRVEELPRRASPPKIVAVAEVAVIVRKRDQVLLVQRGNGGRWESMWEFPHHEVTDDETTDDAACRLLTLLGIEADAIGELCAIEHSVTRFRITMTCHEYTHRRGKGRRANHQAIAWVPVNKLHDYPLSTPQRRLARIIMQ
jgi:A/G-specific adenine glycosylase